MQFRLLIALTIIAILATSPVMAGALDVTAPPNSPPQISSIERSLDDVTKALSKGALTNGEIDDLRNTVSATRIAARDQAETTHNDAKAASQLLEALGHPVEDGPAESPEIARRRTDLAQLVASADALSKRADLALARCEQLQSSLSIRRHQEFTGHLLHALPSPAALGTYATALPELISIASRFEKVALPQDSAEARRAIWGALALLFLVLLLQTISSMAHSAAGKRGHLPISLPIVIASGRLAIPIAAFGAFQLLQNPDGSPIALLGTNCLFVLAPVIAMSAAASSALSPPLRARPLLPVGLRPRQGLARGLFALASILAATAFCLKLAGAFAASAEAISLILTAGGAMALPCLALTLKATERGELKITRQYVPRDAVARTALRRTIAFTRGALFAVLAVDPILLLFGLGNLAIFILTGIVGTAIVIALTATLRRSLREFACWLCGPSSKQISGAFWIGLTADLLIIALAGAGIAFAWGARPADIADSFSIASEGMKLGETTVRPIDILAAILMLSTGLFVSRIIRATVDRRVLSEIDIDPGIRHALGTSISYFGALGSILIAISAGAGIDLSKLAIIAGALSVGIGFGLQGLANNFVSGLVLLIEQPVRVGDFIKIGENEGTVTRIGARACEMQTPAMTHVIIPNADLLSTHLTNWTRRNRLVRREIKLAVSDASDPIEARAELLSVARSHPAVLRDPPPEVQLSDFAQFGYEIMLKVYVDIAHAPTIQSDLRFAIVTRFKSRGIELASPHLLVR